MYVIYTGTALFVPLDIVIPELGTLCTTTIQKYLPSNFDDCALDLNFNSEG